MPPVNPQGSRGGLVAAVVVFTVLFVASTIFAIYFGVQDSKDQDQLTNLQGRYHEIAIDTNGPDVTTLRELSQHDSNLPEQTAMAEAIRQRDNLRRMIVGSAPAQSGAASDQATTEDVSDTLAKTRDAVNKANALLGVTGVKMSSDSLMAALAGMSMEVGNLSAALKAAQTDRDTAVAQATADSQAAHEAAVKADAAVNAAKEELQQQLDAANDAIKKAQDEVGSATKTFQDEQAVSSTALDAADKQRVDLNNELESVRKQMDKLRDKLAGRRIEVEDAIVRRAEGEVVTIATADTVYINLGQGDQIVPGMTFEVYDKTLPLPRLGDGMDEENLPAGKASLEVVRVLPNGAECHVTHVEGGQTIVQGDRILNLIYDRNTKFKFFVYGDFDVARNGHPTPAGADVIKRLIAQWGGQIVDKLDEETDFVIVGTPPEVPIYSAEDLKDPLNEQNLANAKLAADNFDKIVNKAIDLHVAIMNQNKFLYFTGYYDLALR